MSGLTRYDLWLLPIPPIFAAIVFVFIGGPLTSARMAHLLFNILQPVPNLLYFWLNGTLEWI